MISANIIVFVSQFVNVLSRLIVYAIIGRIIMSWFSMGRTGPPGRFGMFLNELTEPVIRIARKLPHRIGMIDLAPLIAILGVDLLGYAIILLLQNLR